MSDEIISPDGEEVEESETGDTPSVVQNTDGTSVDVAPVVEP